MDNGGPYRALSLDLWFTLVYHTREDAAGWDRARIRVLQEFLERSAGPVLTASDIEAGLGEVTSRLEAYGRSPVTTDPAVVLQEVANRLGARVRGPAGVAANAYSAAGLEECPPRPNPEAFELVRVLGRRGVPVVLVTNSSRRSVTWSDFLRTRDALSFRYVVSSSDLGVAKPDPAIFREAARRVAVPPHQLLHVGDRWELDVAGARAAGLGAALYRGLWDRYPRDVYPDLPEPPAELPGTWVLDRLDPLLEPALWEA